MGTSQSSRGPGAGVPMVPPWTPPAPGDVEGQQPPAAPSPSQPIALAPPGRFSGVRRNLGNFARGGKGSDLGRSFARYVRVGYGGAAAATRRFGATTATAAALGGALASLAAGRPAAPGSPLDPKLLKGRTAHEVMDAIVEALRPIDGTQDAEAERVAMREALTKLLDQYPNADLLNLDPDQRIFAIEQFTALDVFRRFELDVGKTIQDKAPSVVAALERLKQAKDYVGETVSAAFRTLRKEGMVPTGSRIAHVVRTALLAALTVFEGYSK
jgi:hypothetical protein